LEEINLLRAPKEIQVTICKDCQAYQLGKQWYSSTPEEPIEDIIKKAALCSVKVARLSESGTELLNPQAAKGVKVVIEPDTKAGLVKITAIGKVHELQTAPKVEKASVKLSLVRRACDTCSFKRARHYEAVLQVRGELSQEKLSRIKTALERLVKEAAGQEEFISDVQKQEGGLDFYLSSTALGRRMASLLKDKFGAHVSQSAKLIGQTKDGRKKFKVTILVKISRKA
jgi:NMD protein affecting ribosome stability and mRNA decay